MKAFGDESCDYGTFACCYDYFNKIIFIVNCIMFAFKRGRLSNPDMVIRLVLKTYHFGTKPNKN